MSKRINFNAAKQDHKAWVGRVRNFLDDKEDLQPGEITSHLTCRMGKWFYGEGKDNYGHLEEIQEFETKHIKLAMFAFKTRIGKQRLYKEFGYKYDRSTKGYIQERLPEEKTLDYFVCLHRESLNSSARDKQVFFLKDGQDRQFYVLDNHFPIMQNFSRLIQSLQN